MFDRNFLLPRDADANKIKTVNDLGIDLSDFLETLRHSGAARFAMIIDACRDNPFSREETLRLLDLVRLSGQVNSGTSTGGRGGRGLAGIELRRSSGGAVRADGQKSWTEGLVAFSAQPGSVSYDGVGQNSYYVEGLREAFANPNRPFLAVLQETNAYVRRVTNDQQIPQIVSDWTREVTLAGSARDPVEYLLSNSTLSQSERDLVLRAGQYDNVLNGTFPLRAGLRLNGTVSSQVSQEEAARAKSLGLPAGVTITYDFDHDGRDEKLHLYQAPRGGEGAVMDIEIDGVRVRAENECNASSYDQVEVALRDVNGDRKPELWVVFGGAWGTLCIFEYIGVPDIASRRRGNSGASYVSISVFRKLLETPAGWSVSVANDESLRICGGSECINEWKFEFDGTRFRQTLDAGRRVKGPSAQPFRNETERHRPSEPEPQSPGAPGLEQRVMALLNTYNTSSDEQELTEIFTATVIAFDNRSVKVHDLVRERLNYEAKFIESRIDIIPGTLWVNSAGLSQYEVKYDFRYRRLRKKDNKLLTGGGSQRLKLVGLGDGSFLISEERAIVRRDQ